MGFGSPTYKRVCTPDPMVRPAGRTTGLCGDDRRAELPDQPNADRSLIASKPPADPRKRTAILAQLVGAIDADNAQHISDRLLSTFGSLGGIFAATSEALDRAAGAPVGALLSHARIAVEASLREKILRARCDPESPLFRDYIRARLAPFREEVLLAVFLDHRNQYIADEIGGQGSVAALTVMGRSLFRRALELNATGLILAHNHPSGSAAPSQADITATTRLERVAAAIDIRLIDHLVVGDGRMVSMRLAGLLS